MEHHDDERTDERRAGATQQVEDYLRLEEHIKRLQANQRPRRPLRLPSDQVRVYQTAALLRAAMPGGAEPDPTFAAQLRARLERERGQSRGGRGSGRARTVSRRNLIAGGLTAAAAAAAGVVAGAGLDRAAHGAPPPTQSTTWTTELVPDGVWVALFPVEALPVGGVRRFVTDQVVGFVRHTAIGFEALSGACTHMGCLVAWNSAARMFACPCHGGRFLENGQAAAASLVVYRPLPAIATRIQDGQVWVYLPSSRTNPSTPNRDQPVDPSR